MGLFKVAVVGLDTNDLASLKSLLSLVTSNKGGWDPVDSPSQAHITFVGGVEPDKMPAMIDKFGTEAFLVFCLHAGEELPPNILSLHRPLRPTELTRVLDIASKREIPDDEPPLPPPQAEKKDDDSEGPSWSAWAS